MSLCFCFIPSSFVISCGELCCIYMCKCVLAPRTGYGVYNYESSVYRGDWEHGKKHGWGEYRHNDGSSYVGEYLAGKKHGYGVCTFSDGAVYDGEWKEGAMIGPATYTYPDGMLFQGQFRGNKKCGKGIYVYPDDSFYQGELLDGLYKHGMVIDEPADGCHYVGCLDKGERHGIGIYFYPGEFSLSQFGDSTLHSSTDQLSAHHLKQEENEDSQIQVPECCDQTEAEAESGRETQYFSMSGDREGRRRDLSLDAQDADTADTDSFSWISKRNIYKGEWKHNQRHGRGEFVKRGEYVYTGKCTCLCAKCINA